MDFVKKNKAAILTGVAVGAIIVAPYAAPAVIGFGSNGIAAGSIAAKMMSTSMIAGKGILASGINIIIEIFECLINELGSTVSTLQSIGALGVPTAVKIASVTLGAGSGVTKSIVDYFKKKKHTPKL